MDIISLQNYKPFILLALPQYDSQPNVCELLIYPICHELNLQFEIALNGVYEKSFSYRLNKQIEKADVIIADFTGLDNNVLSIAGYAKGLGKEVIFLIKNIKTLPIGKDFPSLGESIPFIEYQESMENCKHPVFNRIKKITNYEI